MSEDPCTPREEKQERLSRHKETIQRSQAEEEAHLLAQQRLVYDRSCRALKRRSLIKRHEMEQEQLREVTQVLLTRIPVSDPVGRFFISRPLTSQTTKLNYDFSSLLNLTKEASGRFYLWHEHKAAAALTSKFM